MDYLWYAVIFVLGYLTGRVGHITSLLTSGPARPKSFLSESVVKPIDIDSRKYVTEVDTARFEKSEAALGQTKTVAENISSSASKLAQLKRG